MANKRKEVRLVERNNVSIRPRLNDKRGVGINAYTHDISLHGARVFTKELFDVGSHIKVQIELAGTSELINLEGEVKWLDVKKDEDLFELGIEFKHKISSGVLSLIKHIYQQESKIPASVY